MSLAFGLKEGYMVIFPKKYFKSGMRTVSAPSPSQRLSRAKSPLLMERVL